jgi:hypothetical protein
MSIGQMGRVMFDYIRFLSERWWGRITIIAAFVMPDFLYLLCSRRFVIVGDVSNYIYPLSFFIQDTIARGQSIFWNPFLFSGFPSFVSFGEFFSLGHILLLQFFYFTVPYHILLCLFLILAGYFTAEVIKELGVSSQASLIGGMTYVISTQTVDISVIRGYAFLPCIVLLFLWIAKRKYSWRWLILCSGFVLGSGMLTVHYNFLFIALCGAAACSVYFIYAFSNGTKKDILSMLGAYCAVATIGIVIGSLRFLPLIALLHAASRGGGIPYIEAIQGAFSFGDFLSVVYPKISIPFISSWPFLYVGILPFVFYIYSFFIKHKIKKFLLFALLFCLFVGIEGSPLFRLLHSLPIFNAFRVPSRWMFLGMFFVSILVALGADELFADARKKTKDIISSVFKIILIGLGLFSCAWNVVLAIWGERILAWIKNWFDQNRYASTTGLPLEHYHRVIEDTYRSTSFLFSIFNSSFVITVVLLFATYSLFRWGYRSERFRSYFLTISLLLVGFNYSLVHHLFFVTAKTNVLSYRPDIQNFITHDPGRTLSYLSGFSTYERLSVPYAPAEDQLYSFSNEMLAPNFNLLYSLESASGYDSLIPDAYGKLVSLVEGESKVFIDGEASKEKMTLDRKLACLSEHNNVLDMLGIRYVVSAYLVQTPNLELAHSVSTTQYQIPLYVYKNKSSLPLFYIAQHVSYIDSNAAVDFEKVESTDFYDMTLVGCSDCSSDAAGSGEIRVLDDSRFDRKTIHVDSERGSWLIFNESNLPGWMATIDDEVSKTHSANYVFQALYVPAGHHQVEFYFSYWNLYLSPFFGSMK